MLQIPIAAHRRQAVSPRSTFVEHWFPPRPAYRDSYRQRQRLGQDRMRRSTVMICGLARDLGAIAPLTATRIEQIGTRFRDYGVVLVENDSIDGTQQYLTSWAAANPRVNIISSNIGIERFGPIRLRKRTQALANFREEYRSFVARCRKQYDYVIVVDTDLEGGWSLEGLSDTFGWTEWDAVASNGIGYYPVTLGDVQSRVFKQVQYDPWAYRKRGHLSAHANELINELNFERGGRLVPVASAFGGMAVYTTQAFSSSAYSGEDCEHVPFHFGMATRGYSKIFLNPSQIVLYNLPPEAALVMGSPFAQEDRAADEH